MKGFLIAAALVAAAASPLSAQQDSVRTPADTNVTTTAPAPSAQLSGPRIRAELRPAQSTISSTHESAYRYYDNQTITVSTIVLVLAVVILVLLVAR
jgi:hypothetical protein